MYEENNNEDKFTITLEGILDRNATKSNLKKELLSFKKENFFNQTGLSPKSSKDFLSLSFERLKSPERFQNDNLQKSVSFKSNAFKSSPFNDFLNLDSWTNSLESVLKDLDFSDKSGLAFKHSAAKNNIGSYFRPKADKLDLNSKGQYSYFKTKNMKNAFKQNFISNSNKDQTNKTFKDFGLNSNFDKTELNFSKDDLQEPLWFRNENNQILWEDLMSFRKLFKDSSLVDFLNIKNGFNDIKLPLKEFQNLKDKKILELSLENFILKDSERESVNKMLKGQGSFETEFERNDFLRKLYVLKSSQNSNLNDFSFMVELAQKLKNEGYVKNDSKAISLISDFFNGENNLEQVLSKSPTIYLNNQLKGEPDVFNSNKIINSVSQPRVDPLLEKTLELLEWAKSYDFTNSVLDPLRNTFSNLGNILGQAFESLPLVEYITNVLRDGGGFNSGGIDDDFGMP
ncbi:hypothetical protein [Borreliella bavariensis]|uniref:hypothetical protein n=1 Tax=Borreliella bavariensis TaxID=664662 RepID=UPI001C000E46|nr:hypothetical protein [Borreliella bavariensis]